MPDAAPSPEQVRAALDEVLGWQGISRSPQLAMLLRYVVERTLAGDEGSIKAYSIAVDVFGRSADFDPQSDPIVRVQARRLRTLLEQYYGSGQSHSAVRIHLPVGRYVPEFETIGSTITAIPMVAAAPTSPSRPDRSGLTFRRFALRALLIVAVGVIGVGLAVLLLRLSLPIERGPTETPPTTPRLFVGGFDNLTGDKSLDAATAEFSKEVADRLRGFDEIEVADAAEAGAIILRGSVQGDRQQYSVRATLSAPGNNNMIWSATVSAPQGSSVETVMAQAASILGAQLGNSRGPLHGSRRVWLAAQPILPAPPTHYICMLLYMNWNDTRQIADSERALDCLATLISTNPADGIAVAANAGLSAWRARYRSRPGDVMADRLTLAAADVARALTLSPKSSFVYQQQGLVLAYSGSLDAAFGAFKKSLELNPSNSDAQAEYANILWQDGQWDSADALSQEAVAALESPPSWYFATRALEALRQRHYFDAIDAAQVLATTDDEVGPAIALAAAPSIGRSDLIERYLPVVLGNAQFQQVGILPRLAIRIRQQILLDRLHDGLLAAGVPAAAMTGPFNADGTARP